MLASTACAYFLDGDDEGLRALMSPETRAVLTAERLRQARDRARRANGRHLGVGAPLTGHDSVGEVVDFPLTYERRRAHLQVVIRADEVVGVLLRAGGPTGRWRRSAGLIREVLRPTRATG